MVLLGVVGCVTVLPALILLFDKPLQKNRHKPLIGRTDGFARWLTRAFPAFLVVFALLIALACSGYSKTNDEVYYDMGQSLPFIAPICISTIQLGATVDYAILMTTRYKAERSGGKDKREAISTALSASLPSIIVSGLGLFAATFGVAVYSDIDIIRSMCMLMARGALVSVACVVLFLPALLMLLDKLICHTTLGMKPGKQN